MDEYQLDVTLVPVTLNIANRLMRVPQQWFECNEEGQHTRPTDWHHTHVHPLELVTQEYCALLRQESLSTYNKGIRLVSYTGV